MSPFNNNVEKERKTVKTMIRIYCKNLQYSIKQFCDDCLKVFEYTNKKLEYCN
ncbi:MAG: nitrous oxide-stimulated promoter family protein [Promethearchaeota archaeon]